MATKVWATQAAWESYYKSQLIDTTTTPGSIQLAVVGTMPTLYADQGIMYLRYNDQDTSGWTNFTVTQTVPAGTSISYRFRSAATQLALGDDWDYQFDFNNFGLLPGYGWTITGGSFATNTVTGGIWDCNGNSLNLSAISPLVNSLTTNFCLRMSSKTVSGGIAWQNSMLLDAPSSGFHWSIGTTRIAILNRSGTELSGYNMTTTDAQHFYEIQHTGTSIVVLVDGVSRLGPTVVPASGIDQWYRYAHSAESLWDYLYLLRNAVTFTDGVAWSDPYTGDSTLSLPASPWIDIEIKMKTNATTQNATPSISNLTLNNTHKGSMRFT